MFMAQIWDIGFKRIVKDEIIHPTRRATDEFRIRLDSEYYVCLKTITKYKK